MASPFLVSAGMPAASGDFLTWGIIIVKKGFVVLTCVLLIEGCATIMGARAANWRQRRAKRRERCDYRRERLYGIQRTNACHGDIRKKRWQLLGGKSHRVEVSKQAYQTQAIPVKSSPNGWYIVGNLDLGPNRLVYR
jgi:hypothetical protein